MNREQPMDNAAQEKLAVELNCDAPRNTVESITAKIADVEYRAVKSFGKAWTYCYIQMDDGWVQHGKPAVSVSVENERDILAEEIAYANTFEELWSLMGYRLYRGI